MASGKKSLVWGIIIGIVFSAFFFNFFAPRYEIKKTTASAIKIDKWTGKAWRLVEDKWEEMINIDEDWESIDKALQQAVNISWPELKVDSSAALKKLRDKYPVLKDIPDYDLQERIKVVFSRQIMVNSYLIGFMNLDKAAETTSQE